MIGCHLLGLMLLRIIVIAIF
uniref:Uncharacterized protein n=1 Tax=Rhizophora mucronata TaxID=61149 RepID=A0A2P2Q194_RHIMU